MLNSALRTGAVDRLAIGLSGLCLVHCVASAVFVTLLASAGGLLLHPAVHELGIGLAILLGLVGLGRGVLQHGFMLPSFDAYYGPFERGGGSTGQALASLPEPTRDAVRQEMRQALGDTGGPVEIEVEIRIASARR